MNAWLWIGTAGALAFLVLGQRARGDIDPAGGSVVIDSPGWKWAGGSWREARWHCSLVPPPQASGR